MTHRANNTLLLATLDLAESLGLTRSAIHLQLGLDQDSAETPGALVPSSIIIDAMEFAAAETRRKDFGMLIADRRDHLNLGLLGLVIEQCQTVAEIHDVGSRFLHLHNDALDFELSRGVMRLHIATSSHYKPRHYVEALLAMYVRIMWLVLGPRWRPAAVNFAHDQLAGRSAYERRFGRAVKFKQKFNSVSFKPGETEHTAPRNPQTKLKLESLMQEIATANAGRDFGEEVSRLVRMLLPSRGATVARIAGLMGTSPRSLQRKLKTSGSSFGAILAETRAGMAREYLRLDGLTVVQLAPLLGFSEPSAVSRFLREQLRTNARALKRDGRQREPRAAR